MKRDAKKLLYENIMATVAKEVKKALNEDINNDNYQEEIIVLTPDELKELLKFIDGNEDRGVCIRYQANHNDEWQRTSVCFYDERTENGPRRWPWQEISYKFHDFGEDDVI